MHRTVHVVLQLRNSRTDCNCGLTLSGASDEVRKLFLQNIMNCFSVLTSQLHHKARGYFKSAVKKQYKNILDRYSEDAWYRRQHLQSQSKIMGEL